MAVHLHGDFCSAQKISHDRRRALCCYQVHRLRAEVLETEQALQRAHAGKLELVQEKLRLAEALCRATDALAGSAHAFNLDFVFCDDHVIGSSLLPFLHPCLPITY